MARAFFEGGSSTGPLRSTWSRPSKRISRGFAATNDSSHIDTETSTRPLQAGVIDAGEGDDRERRSSPFLLAQVSTEDLDRARGPKAILVQRRQGGRRRDPGPLWGA